MSEYCLGGWCLKREKCAAYHNTPRPGAIVVDARRCAKGIDTPRFETRMSLQECMDVHETLAEAHRTILLGLKYPGTVALGAVQEAKQRVSDMRMVATQTEAAQ